MEETSGYKEYVAGLLAGVATVVIGHPSTPSRADFPVLAYYRSFQWLAKGYYSAAFDGSSRQL
ncbi:hypothetical protein CK203_025781 [Vitis vinifera]|uniref:Uncharacterized protein n=1 Tax=Vitis vinifera TaxID=29760 RepID=A0A438IGW5_VITVI|nr:hypothetical protein CK203_025781 [Vitis vinifera]